MKDSIELFNKSWNTYRKVVEADYMSHKVFHKLTDEAFQIYTLKKELSILDLGCGDGSGLKSIIQNIKDVKYIGYDLSEIAISLAKKTLGFLGAGVQFVEGNMEESIMNESNKFDVIHSSFAIHHLLDPQKEEFLKSISSRLYKGGTFIYIDVFKSENVSRDHYVQMYCNNMERDWDKLNTDDKIAIKAHIEAFDFPTSIELILRATKAVGLSNLKIETSDDIHYFLSFVKD